MVDWRKEFEKKIISAEEAANLIKPGDRVVFATGKEPVSIGYALASRKEELKGVKIFAHTPAFDYGWYDEGWEDSFAVTVRFPTNTVQEAMDAGRLDFDCGTLIPFQELPGRIDVLLTQVTPPDDKGFCSFGASMWAKKRQIKEAKLVIVEMDERLIRTGGDNFVHFSEIDYFVEHEPTPVEVVSGSLAGRTPKEPEPYLKDIAGYVNGLIRDGDTLQIGVGRTAEPLVKLGLFNGKHDLGWHSEATPPGVISLIREGVINGKYKTINQGRAVVTAIGGGSKEEMEWVNNNPLIWLVDVLYLEDIRVIASHDNFVALNNALMVELTGQICSETIGTRQISAAGGQIPFVFGAALSKGGRSIIVLPSAAKTKNGLVSRIVPVPPPGTVVTIPRNVAQYIVTEYGVASLWGKTLRERANELIGIAHPDLRAELKKEAQGYFKWLR